jgi:hypothetical protein
VPPGPPENHPVNTPTSSSSNPPPESSDSAARRTLISLGTKRFQLPAEPRKTDVAMITEFPPLPEMSYDNYDADDERDILSDLGGTEHILPVSLKHTEFSLKQIAEKIGYANYSAFNKWKKGGVAVFLEKKQRSIIRGQTWLKQVCNGPLHWEMAVVEFLETLETSLPLDNFDHAEWIYQQWGQIFWKICAREIWEVRKKRRQGNMRPATDLGERAGKKARSNLWELPNTTSMVVIHWVSNGKDMVLAPKQL